MLSAIQVRNAKVKPGGKTHKLHDGNGLYLFVRETSKSWVYRFMFDGKQREMGLGKYPDISLAEARKLLVKYRGVRARGEDPIEFRKREKPAAITFSELAKEFLDFQSPGWSSKKTRHDWDMTLRLYAHPVIGDLPVDRITTDHILQILKPIWAVKTETASKTRQRIHKILAFGASRGFRSWENPAAWAGHLEFMLPKPSKIAPVSHLRAYPYQDMPNLYKAILGASGLAAQALQLTILTAARSGVVVQAEWADFDLKQKLWTVPAHKMKSRDVFRIPLSTQAVELLGSLDVYMGLEHLVFPSTITKGPLNGEGLLKLLQTTIGVDATVHGFRTSFRVWVAEQTNFSYEAGEIALSHKIGSDVTRAYLRSDYLDERREMMQAWADYLTI